MRVIFLGTPEFACPTLEKLIAWDGCQVVGLVTQPDRPAGRGRKLFPPPTKILATSRGIPVLQPERLSRAPEVVDAMRELAPDVLVTVAFGQILKQDVLTLSPMGVVNLHGSLLPKLRGAAPINWAIINGDTVTGVTTMLCDAGVDTGPVLLKQEVPIGCDTNAEELAQTMAWLGADLMIRTLAQLRDGKLRPEPQDDFQATHAPRLTKDIGKLDWSLPAERLHNLVRGLVPWPGAFTYVDGSLLKILASRRATPDRALQPGTLARISGLVLVACGSDGQERLELIEVQPESKSRMAARDWINGMRLSASVRLGTMRGLAARRLAVEVLLKVEQESAYANLALAAAFRKHSLPERDRAFATFLVQGVLRHQRELDEALKPYSARPPDKLSVSLRNILRIAAFQLMHVTDIPPSAVLNTSAELAKRLGHAGNAAYCTAVLRRFLKEREAPAAESSPPAIADRTATVEELANRYSVSEWLVERWLRFYGGGRNAPAVKVLSDHSGSDNSGLHHRHIRPKR